MKLIRFILKIIDGMFAMLKLFYKRNIIEWKARAEYSPIRSWKEHFQLSEKDFRTYLFAIVSILSLEGSASGKTHDNYPVLTDVCQINVEAILCISLARSADKCSKHLIFVLLWFSDESCYLFFDYKRSYLLLWLSIYEKAVTVFFRG